MSFYAVKLADGRELHERIRCSTCGAATGPDGVWATVAFPTDYVCGPCVDEDQYNMGYVKVESVRVVTKK